MRRLEAGEVDLEESLTLYEEGMALVARCQAQLESADARVVQLTRGARGIEECPVADVDEA